MPFQSTFLSQFPSPRRGLTSEAAAVPLRAAVSSSLAAVHTLAAAVHTLAAAAVPSSAAAAVPSLAAARPSLAAVALQLAVAVPHVCLHVPSLAGCLVWSRSALVAESQLAVAEVGVCFELPGSPGRLVSLLSPQWVVLARHVSPVPSVVPVEVGRCPWLGLGLGPQVSPALCGAWGRFAH